MTLLMRDQDNQEIGERRGEEMLAKILNFGLVFAMVITLMGITAPIEIQAANIGSFKGTGTSGITIRDTDCFKADGKTYEVNYIKFKPGVTGTVTVKMENASQTVDHAEAVITLCDKNKNVIGQKNEWWTTAPEYAEAYQKALSNYDISFKKANFYTRTYGVKKGTTYYFAVKSAAGVKLTATVNKVGKGSNSSLAKAKTLAKNKKAESVMIVGDKTADWYKIKLKKSAKIQLLYTTKTNGTIAIPDDKMGIQISFYKASGKLFYKKGGEKSQDYISNVIASRWCKFYNVDSKGEAMNLDAGTYYIKVQRLTTRSSGQYTLKWKTY